MTRSIAQRNRTSSDRESVGTATTREYAFRIETKLARPSRRSDRACDHKRDTVWNWHLKRKASGAMSPCAGAFVVSTHSYKRRSARSSVSPASRRPESAESFGVRAPRTWRRRRGRSRAVHGIGGGGRGGGGLPLALLALRRLRRLLPPLHLLHLELRTGPKLSSSAPRREREAVSLLLVAG